MEQVHETTATAQRRWARHIEQTIGDIRDMQAYGVARYIWEQGPVTGDEIARAMHISRRAVSRIVHDLVVEYRLPVGGKMVGRERGYYIISSADDARREERALTSRITHIGYRLHALLRIFAPASEIFPAL